MATGQRKEKKKKCVCIYITGNEHKLSSNQNAINII